MSTPARSAIPLLRRHADAWVPLLIGLASFFVLVGPRVLRWDNLAWLGHGDSATHYLGWLFFRQGPWTLPLGMNPDYGLALANSIVYSDSNPLLALLFKPFGPWLPTVFQYFGFWILACFLLQAWIAYRLLGLATQRASVRAMGTVFFAFAPIMMIRLTEHLSLGGHFLLLAALYLVCAPAPRRRRLAWWALLAVSVLVHAYLFAMVALLWLVDLGGRSWRREVHVRSAVLEAALGLGLTALACWQAGYFVPGGGAAQGGYGFYRANVLALFNPMGWSYLLDTIAQGPGEYEGYVYLGLGVLLLYACALPRLLQAPRTAFEGWRRHALLGLALVGLTLFAISNTVGFGPYAWSFPLPDRLYQLAGVFRASGRMMWPVYYALVLLSIVLVLRLYPPRAAAVLLAIGLAVQLVDTHAGWSQQRWHWMRTPATAWETPLRDPFWALAGQRYAKLRLAPPQNAAPRWQPLADYAGRHGMATDAVYLARVDARALAAAQADMRARLQEGRYDADTLYVIEGAGFVAAALAAQGGPDLYAQVDGFQLIAPGWSACAACPEVAGAVSLQALAGQIVPGRRLGFSETDEQAAGWLGSGWSHREPWGTWSAAREAELVLPLDTARVRALDLELQPLLGPGLERQRIEVLVDGVPAARAELAAAGVVRVALPAPAPEAGVRLVRIGFRIPDAARPADLGTGADHRLLGLGIIAATPVASAHEWPGLDDGHYFER
ncbi:hypothetical protein FOZ76_20690 [Verticiella sediminum]|uniref:YfhO family protein n=1 Tax=Verticiella sediminum TaxID=1247510 RepID=A0A556ABJ1_9BURK|nr:DUF6311 domain-containing protein [Verticiella sediminum]TSH90255.1 hypothetical protein FOZ76_20690 [Verticiella sediminum]